MSETSVVSPLKGDRERGFTEAERHEIISRLQVVENVCAGISSQLSALMQDLFPEAVVGGGEPPRYVNMVREIHGFAMKLDQVLGAMAGSPMFAAMMPPDVASAMMEGQ